MKKVYIAPKTLIVEFAAEDAMLIAGSVRDTVDTNSKNQFSNKLSDEYWDWDCDGNE